MKENFFGDFFTGFGDGIILPLGIVSLLSNSSYSTDHIFKVGIMVCLAGGLLMGLSNWLTQKQELKQALHGPPDERLDRVLEEYGFTEQMKQDALGLQTKDEEAWQHFVEKYELKNKAAYPPLLAGCITAFSFFIGGLIPLLPFLFLHTAADALLLAVTTGLLFLLWYGFYKTYFAGKKSWLEKLQPALLGLLVFMSTFAVGKYLISF